MLADVLMKLYTGGCDAKLAAGAKDTSASHSLLPAIARQWSSATSSTPPTTPNAFVSAPASSTSASKVPQWHPTTPRIGTISQLRKLYPEHQILDEEEEDWLEHLKRCKVKRKESAQEEEDSCRIKKFNKRK
ncbi:Mitochondrial ribosomal protein of the small protein [Pyrenophora tritici-repentis]|nr:Mitochondrial ribosomal protein of the small protein [Pyrenophora tritici-repentis]